MLLSSARFRRITAVTVGNSSFGFIVLEIARRELILEAPD